MRLPLLGAVGALGSCCVLLGVLRPGSPFVAEGSPSWFWTSPVVPAGRPESTSQFLGIVLVYLGLALLLGAWFETIRAIRTGARISVQHLLLILVAWAAPILLAPPLFSRDVYSYAAQGQMVARGLNPYLHGPSVLGPGPFLTLVDPLWRHATAPYGPAWERLSGWVVQLSGHRVVWAVVGFRLVAVLGLALVAWGVPALARAAGRDGALAFAVAVLNPLVLLVLLGGAHNDALMLGLLVLGCVLAARRHPLAGLACCALAAEVKAPALLAVLFIGWAWWGQGQARKLRLAKTLLAVCFTLAVMAAIGAAVDLSWRWVGALLGAGTVVSWLDPVTAIGLALAHLAHAVGYHGGSGAFVRGARVTGLAVAAAVTIRMLIRPPGPEQEQERSGARPRPGLEHLRLRPAGPGHLALVLRLGVRLPGGGGRRVDPPPDGRPVGHRLFRHHADPPPADLSPRTCPNYRLGPPRRPGHRVRGQRVRGQQVTQDEHAGNQGSRISAWASARPADRAPPGPPPRSRRTPSPAR